MSRSALQEAVRRLADHYGRQVEPGPNWQWLTVVEVVAGPAGRGQAVAESPLGDPAWIAETPADLVRDAIETDRRNTRRTGVLVALARWWCDSFGPEPFATPPERSVRDELAVIRGVGPELLDRLRLYVAGERVVPISRATIRVACRHGWCSTEAEYDEWQHVLCQAADDAAIELAQLPPLFARVGREFCRTQPRCDECPLEPLLPSGGPYEPVD